MNIFLASQVWTTIYETFSNVFSAIGNAVANNVVISIFVNYEFYIYGCLQKGL